MHTVRPLFITLFCTLTLLIALSGSANANAVAGLPAHRRSLETRMLKKRAPLPQGPDDPPNAGGNGGVDTDTNTATTPGGRPTNTGTTTTSTSTSTTSTSTTGTGTSRTGTATATSISSSSSSSSTSSSSTSTSQAPSSTQESETLQVTSAATQPPVNDNGGIAQPVTRTITSSAADESETAAAKPSSNTSRITKTTLTVIIVIASCVGGVALIWTIIRKWKFRPSAEFEDRMQPIDWQPTAGHHDDGLPHHRRRTSHGSFHSGSDHSDSYSRGHGATSDHGHGNNSMIPDLPPHDFTAGPTSNGYVDFNRGPSPQPQMQSLARGPSTRGYGAYESHGPRY